MEKEFTILIADRNHHVRELLKREMMAEGYIIRVAKNGQEVLKWVYDQEPLDLVILDLDLPDFEETQVLDKINDRVPYLPVVIHTFVSEYNNNPAIKTAAGLVEKDGSSISRLKEMVSSLLGGPIQRKQKDNGRISS
ncbi:conserved hypothetical protein [uncultured Desulfobacterium sp.]|uniref:Response regulatory domain-containing protein n=1 Tax=uncultured Desulfobacterium sp. TaxID=201089 RepID=A0A445MY91_9BACT|nr:conserved hypothetical protein [uncultured Desulfobacterium sp.]